MESSGVIEKYAKDKANGDKIVDTMSENWGRLGITSVMAKQEDIYMMSRQT